MSFDVNRALNLISDFLRRWATQLGEISERASGVFEVFSTVLVLLVLRRNGFKVEAQNLRNNVFVAKRGVRGDPNNYSFFTAERNTARYEIRQNQYIRGCHQGFYLINEDIVIMNEDSLQRTFVSQNNVVTFVSCKHLSCYPSLIADFIGEVHEIQHFRLQSRITYRHPPALLMTSGSITGGGQNLRDSLQRFRGYNIRIFGSLTPSFSNRSIRQFLRGWQI
jgi:hypothetical protein